MDLFSGAQISASSGSAVFAAGVDFPAVNASSQAMNGSIRLASLSAHWGISRVMAVGIGMEQVAEGAIGPELHRLGGGNGEARGHGRLRTWKAPPTEVRRRRAGAPAVGPEGPDPPCFLGADGGFLWSGAGIDQARGMGPGEVVQRRVRHGRGSGAGRPPRRCGQWKRASFGTSIRCGNDRAETGQAR